MFGADFEHGWDFVPGQEAIILTGREDEHPRSALHDFTGIRFEADGYNWKQLYYYGMPTREKKIGNRTVETRSRKVRILDSGRHQVYEEERTAGIRFPTPNEVQTRPLAQMVERSPFRIHRWRVESGIDQHRR